MSPRTSSHDGADAGTPGSRSQDAEQAERKLEAAIVAGTQSTHAFRGEPVLRRRSDGSYQYSGVGFHAVIERDGSLRMSNVALRPELHMQSTVLPDGKTGGFNFLRVDLGLLKAVQAKLGTDLDRSERRWFLERTRDLRERLSEKHASARRSAASPVR